MHTDRKRERETERKRAPRDKKVKQAKDVLLLSILENCLSYICCVCVCVVHSNTISKTVIAINI